MGLIRAQLLDGSGGNRVIGWPDISKWKRTDEVLWIHLDYSDTEPHEWLKNASKIDPLVIDFLFSEDTRPRCNHFSSELSDGLMLSLRGINHTQGGDPEDMVAIRIWAEEKLLITSRRRRLLVNEQIFSLLDRGAGPKDVGELLVSLTDHLVDGVTGVIGAQEDRVDAMEEENLLQSDNNQRMQILELRREIIQLRRYLAPQREALSRLHSENASWLVVEDRLHIREIADHVSKHIDDLDSIKDRCGVAYEEFTSRLAEETNKRMYLLSIVAGIFMPLGFLTGLLGINVGGIPAAESPLGFFWVVVFLLLIGGGQLFYFWRQRWI